MIDRIHKLSVVRQCEILELARSTAYYTPKPTSVEDLALMRRIDELHLEYPFAGSRMLRDLLRNEGQPVGRKRVRRLMRQMGIEALYRKPNTSRRHATHPIYPYRYRRAACINGLAQIEKANWLMSVRRNGYPASKKWNLPACGGSWQKQNRNVTC